MDASSRETRVTGRRRRTSSIGETSRMVSTCLTARAGERQRGDGGPHEFVAEQEADVDEGAPAD
jgi:hypothetical protein